MDDKGLRIADVRDVGEKLHGVNEALPCCEAALYTETDERPVGTAKVFRGRAMTRVLLESGIVDPGDKRMFLEKPRDFEGVFRMFLLPQRERLQTLEKKKGVEGRQCRT